MSHMQASGTTDVQPRHAKSQKRPTQGLNAELLPGKTCRLT